MGNQVVAGNEGGKPLHHLLRRWGLGQHLIGDAGVFLDETAHPLAGIHETLESVNNPVVPDQYRTDLDGPVAIAR